jgi:hypothetical protein
LGGLIGKVLPPYRSVRVYVIVDVNHLLKIGSERSRPLGNRADTVVDTRREARVPAIRSDASGQPERTYRVKDWLDRFWRNTPFELRGATHLPRPILPKRHEMFFVRKLGECHDAACADSAPGRASTWPGREARQFDSSIVKETWLDEVEHFCWIAGIGLRPEYPGLRFRIARPDARNQ